MVFQGKHVYIEFNELYFGLFQTGFLLQFEMDQKSSSLNLIFQTWLFKNPLQKDKGLEPFPSEISKMFDIFIMFLFKPMLERIYNPITAMVFLAMFTFQLDNTKR